MTKKYDESFEINHNPNWLYSWLRNALLNFMKHQRSDIEKIYLYLKDPLKSMYRLLINGREKIETKKLNNSRALNYYLQTFDVSEHLEDYNSTKESVNSV